MEDSDIYNLDEDEILVYNGGSKVNQTLFIPLCRRDANVFVRDYCKIVRKEWIGNKCKELALFIHLNTKKMTMYDINCVIERYVKDCCINVKINSYIIRQVYRHQLVLRCTNPYQRIYLI